MHTRSVTLGWPKRVYRGNKTSELGNMLATSATREDSVNTGLYKDETGGALDPLTKKRVAYQRKTWSITECKELRKQREEGQSFSDLSTVRALLLSSNYEAVHFIDDSIAFWRVGFRRDSAVLQGETFR